MKDTQIKERPILFSGPMVRAILEGRKTQTRRVAKFTGGGHVRLGKRRWHPGDPEAVLACPYGQPGARLWVRETWQHENGSCENHKCGQPTHIYYKATEVYPESMIWRPSTFMPRWASRIDLEIEGVRVERLQEINDADIRSEGVTAEPLRWRAERARRAIFPQLWDSLNAKRGFGWDKNPWVWVVEFRKVNL